MNRSPTRRSQRVNEHLQQSPTKKMPDVNMKTSPAVQISVLASIYLAFLAQRHLHIYVTFVSFAVLLPSLVALIMLQTGTLQTGFLFCLVLISCIGVLWYYFARPKVHACARSVDQIYFLSDGPAGQGTKNHRLASCYVAATGYKDEYGEDLLGLYANEYIPAG